MMSLFFVCVALGSMRFSQCIGLLRRFIQCIGLLSLPAPPLGPLPKVHVAVGGRGGDAARATAEQREPSELIPVPTAIFATEPCATSVKERERASKQVSEQASEREIYTIT